MDLSSKSYMLFVSEMDLKMGLLELDLRISKLHGKIITVVSLLMKQNHPGVCSGQLPFEGFASVLNVPIEVSHQLAR